MLGLEPRVQVGSHGANCDRLVWARIKTRREAPLCGAATRVGWRPCIRAPIQREMKDQTLATAVEAGAHSRNESAMGRSPRKAGLLPTALRSTFAASLSLTSPRPWAAHPGRISPGRSPQSLGRRDQARADGRSRAAESRRPTDLLSSSDAPSWLPC